jgi:hypothetical protein
MVAPAPLWRRLAGLPEFDDFGDLVLATRALIDALIITIAADQNRDEIHLRTTLRAPR